jgi:hypothetical protein
MATGAGRGEREIGVHGVAWFNATSGARRKDRMRSRLRPASTALAMAMGSTARGKRRMLKSAKAVKAVDAVSSCPSRVNMVNEARDTNVGTIVHSTRLPTWSIL